MLGVVRGHLHPALFTHTAIDRLGETMATIPDALTTLFYFEARLDGDSTVDLVMHVAADARGTLCDHASREIARSSPGNAGSWTRVRELAHAWGDTNSALSRPLHHLWLEFDSGGPRVAERPTPGVFACFGEIRRPDFTTRRWHAHSVAALGVLLAGTQSDGLGRRLAACFAALPPSAYLPYIGVMLGRPDENVRLCVIGMPAETLGPFLSELGWRRIEEATSIVRELSAAQPQGPLQGAGMIHLDVSPSGVWRLGLEFACDRMPQLRGELRETSLLDALERCGLATRAKLDGLLAWPGTSVVRVPASSGARVIVRRLNHVKVVFEREAPARAKAYLAANHLPRTELHAATVHDVRMPTLSDGALLCT